MDGDRRQGYPEINGKFFLGSHFGQFNRLISSIAWL
jgi:hypothetical protein